VSGIRIIASHRKGSTGHRRAVLRLEVDAGKSLDEARVLLGRDPKKLPLENIGLFGLFLGRGFRFFFAAIRAY
jgi:hypothetical protein